MGEEDGVAKTPQWAAPITGVPARDIKALAKEWASKRTTVVIGNGGPGIRGPYATEPARLQGICLAMQGLGKPGVNQAKMIEWGLFDKPDQYAQPKPLRVPNLRSAYTGGHPDESNHPSFVPKTYVPKAILEGQCDWWGCESETADRTNQFVHYKYPADGCSKIHMVWTDSPSWITCWNSGNDYVRAMRHPDIEFMFAQHPWLENDCLLADIILPVNTKLEEDDIAGDIFSGQYQPAVPRAQVRRADRRVVQRLRDRLHDRRAPRAARGVHRRQVDPRPHQARLRDVALRGPHQLGGAKREGLLRGAHRRRLGRRAGRLLQLLQGPREVPADDPDRQARVRSHRSAQELPGRPRASAGAQVGRSGREPRRDDRHRALQEVSAAGVLQPPALERPLPARRHHLAARDRHLQGHRSRRLSVPPGVAAPQSRPRSATSGTATSCRSSTTAARCSAAPT